MNDRSKKTLVKIDSTFKQIEQKSLCVCYLYVLLLIWSTFLLILLFVVIVQEAEGVVHLNGVAENQAVVVLTKVFSTNSHFLISLSSS